MQLVPGLRSGIYTEFPIEIVTGGTLVLVRANGSFVPAGAVVRVQGRSGEFPVGLRGEVFLPTLADSNELIVNWENRQCEAIVKLPQDRQALAALGTFTCTGSRP